MTSTFFNATEVSKGVTAIAGLGMELCYLVVGTEGALLIDTLSGIGNLKAFCRELTDLPIIVVNTHGHVDHCGGNFDFGSCYLHPDDIELLYTRTTREARMDFIQRMQSMSQTRTRVSIEDLTEPCPLKTFPVYDGTIFDLGGKRIEVVAVPGHSHGSIVLLDRSLRMVFSGDACNANTLLFLEGSTTIERYLESLRHFKTFQPDFDVMYGGHGLVAIPNTIIDEAIELCLEILEGTDDAIESSFLSRPCYYAKKAEKFRRLDGKIANIAYSKEKIRGSRPERVIRARG